MIMKDWPARNSSGPAGKLDLEAERTLLRLEALARLMDSAFVIPGTTIKMGLDGIIGLLPVVGDAVAGLVSTYLIWEARRLNVPKWVLARMLANTMFDTVIGSVPVLGDAFDVLFRANLRNMALLRRHLEKNGAISRPGAIIEGEAIRV